MGERKYNLYREAATFEERPDVRYGLTTMCVGIGMGGTVIWENVA